MISYHGALHLSYSHWPYFYKYLAALLLFEKAKGAEHQNIC